MATWLQGKKKKNTQNKQPEANVRAINHII